MKSPKIMVIGLNPAWQKVLLFEEMRLGCVNRAKRLEQFSSGKGANFARASIICGANPVVFQFAGGNNGRLLTKGLDDESIKHETVITRAETRTCVTCIEESSERVTELIEPARQISKTEVKKLFANIAEKMDSFDAVTICGTCPPGTPLDFYPRIAKLAKKKKIPLLVDTFISLKEILIQGVEVLKINADELKEVSGCNDTREGAVKLASLSKVRIIAITNGALSSFLFYDNKFFEFHPKKIKALNSTGAGDTVSAVFFCNLLRGKNPKEAFSLALAAGTASCLTLVSGHFQKKTAKAMPPDEPAEAQTFSQKQNL